MPLTGTLRDLSLANLVQLQCTEQNFAQVQLTRGGRQGKLMFAGGDLVYALVGDKTGEDAVYELLTWEEGDFRVDYENINVERNVNYPWSALLLEGLRLADEARAERNSAMEGQLKGMRGKQGLREAVLTNGSGLVRADAKDKNTVEDAALVAFAAGRAEAVGSALGLGSFTGLTAVTASEKIVIEKMDGDYLGCWMDPRATSEQIKATLTAAGLAR